MEKRDKIGKKERKKEGKERKWEHEWWHDWKDEEMKSKDLKKEENSLKKEKNPKKKVERSNRTKKAFYVLFFLKRRKLKAEQENISEKR